MRYTETETLNTNCLDHRASSLCLMTIVACPYYNRRVTAPFKIKKGSLCLLKDRLRTLDGRMDNVTTAFLTQLS